MKRRKLVLYIVCGVLCLLWLLMVVNGQIYYSSQMQNRFPRWEEAVEQPDPDGVTAELVGVDLGFEDAGTARDVVNVDYHLESYTGIHPSGWWIDFLYEGNWYTVYRPSRSAIAAGCAYTAEPGSYHRSFEIPSGVLDISGQYRVYFEGLGYCEFILEKGL